MNTAISIIEEMPLMIGDRVRILLTYRNVKPASFVDLFDPNRDTNKPDSYDLPKQVEVELEHNLARVGLQYLKRDRAIVVGEDEIFMQRSLYFGRDKESLTRLLTAHSPSEFGIAFGFPQSAIEAYIGKRKRFHGQFPEDISNDTLRFSEFVKSADNWREELKTPQQWADVTRSSSLYLYQTYMQESLVTQ